MPSVAVKLHGRACFQQGDDDTPAKAKSKAETDALRNLVASYKMYVFATAESENFILQTDEILAIAAGVLHKKECSFPPVANYSVCAECFAEVDEKEMDRFLEERLRKLGMVAGGKEPGLASVKRVGQVAVRSNGAGTLSVNGKVIEKIPANQEVTIPNLPIGTHEIGLDIEGRKLSREVFVSEKEVTPVNFRDEVSALSALPQGELISLKVIADAMSYLNKNYGLPEDIEAQLRKRLIGRRILGQGFVISVGEPGKSLSKTSWARPDSKLDLYVGQPLILMLPSYLNHGVNIKAAILTSDMDFPYSSVFHGGFEATYPGLMKRHLDGSADWGALISGGRAISNVVSGMTSDAWERFGRQFSDRGSPRIALLGFVGTIESLDLSYSDWSRIGLLFIEDAKVVSINNADPKTWRTEIFEANEAKEVALDAIFGKSDQH